MEKQLLLIFCFLNLISIIYTQIEDIEDDKNYGLDGLIRKNVGQYENALHVKRNDFLHQFKFEGIDDEWQFEPSDLQLYSPKCLRDIMHIFKNIKSPWAMKLIDSYGKQESGILNGNTKWIGQYNECIGIRVSSPNATFRGKYCSLSWSLKLFNLSQPFTLTSGMCIPDSCSSEELQHDALQLLRISGTLAVLDNSYSTIKTIALQCKPVKRHLNSAAKAMIALLSIFCVVAVLGSSITVVKYFKKIIQDSNNTTHADGRFVNNHVNGKSNGTLHKHGVQDDEALLQNSITAEINVSVFKNLQTFLGCFCVFTNGAKLLNTSSSEGELLCIHGIRFLSMSWVILGHTYVFGLQQCKNMFEVNGMINNLPFQAILQGFFSVDSFFVLSGFLLTFLTMKEFSKTKGRISWAYFYIRRYLRLTPMYMVLLGFSATVFFYLGSGPFWPDGDYDPACKKVWWKHLIYINNFNLDAGQCMGWSWYLANDMQFYIISPLFLITLWRWPKIGYTLLAMFLLASCLSNFFITYRFDLLLGIVTILNESLYDMASPWIKFQDTFKKLYVKPYSRISPYLVGMLTGFIFFKRKASNAPKHSLWFLIIGWIISSSVTLTIVYGLYYAHPGLIARSFYNALSRVCYAAGLSWVIYVCLIGQGGFINSLLSFKLFIPLSRLTYAAYLIHPMVIRGYLLSMKSTLEFSHPTIVTLFLGFIVVTYALALPVSLILESPIVALEKLVRKQFSRKQKKEAVN